MLLFLLFFNYWLTYFLILAVITQIFDPIAEHAISVGIPTKEAKAEMEKHPLTKEINIIQYNINAIQNSVNVFILLTY